MYSSPIATVCHRFFCNVFLSRTFHRIVSAFGFLARFIRTTHAKWTNRFKWKMELRFQHVIGISWRKSCSVCSQQVMSKDITCLNKVFARNNKTIYHLMWAKRFSREIQIKWPHHSPMSSIQPKIIETTGCHNSDYIGKIFGFQLLLFSVTPDTRCDILSKESKCIVFPFLAQLWKHNIIATSRMW